MEINDVSLQRRLAHVAELEAQLEATRASARMAAKMTGLSTSHLFGETKFVPRSTAERWISDAREDALTDDSEAYKRGVRAGFDNCLETGATLRRLAEGPHSAKYETLRGLVDEARRRAAFEAAESGDAATTDPSPQTIARQIISAGAKARGASGPLPPTGTLARSILDAGAKRRGEEPDDQAETDQDDEGQPNGDDSDTEQPTRKRKKGKSKQHPDSDEVPEVLTPPERDDQTPR
jgi:hypothetical protein